MKVIIKSKNEANHIHPYARKKYAETLEVAELYAVQRAYCGVKVKEWHQLECNSKTASFETADKQEDSEVITLLRQAVENRVLAGEAVKVTFIRDEGESIVLADVKQGAVERLAELYNFRAEGKEYDESEMESLGLNMTNADTLLA